MSRMQGGLGGVSPALAYSTEFDTYGVIARPLKTQCTRVRYRTLLWLVLWTNTLQEGRR